MKRQSHRLRVDPREQKWSARLLMKYSLFQVPELVIVVLALLLLRQWWGFSLWVFWGIIGAWVTKDVVLFPYVWRSYVNHGGEESSPMVDARGTTREHLAPSGYVFVRGELWRAEVAKGSPPIPRGRTVRVRAVRGLTLIVEPEGEEE
jgi:membrane-bound ClpP family serine protease